MKITKLLYRRLLSCFLIISGLFFLSTPSVITNFLLKIGLQIREGNHLAKLWEVNPIPLYWEFYAFNWTNPEDINSPGIKPKFEEIGPFIFHETRTKDIITWNDNGTVSYRLRHIYVFDRERSAFDLNTPITTLNPVLISISHMVQAKNWSFWVRKGIQVALQQLKQNLTITIPFGEYLFDGYDDKIINMATSISGPFAQDLPFEDKVAIFYRRNSTSHTEGDFTMGTTFDNFGILEEWNHSNSTPYYEGECGSLKGASTGEVFLSSQHGDTLSVFIPDMCRPITLDYENDHEVEGIKGRKFKAGVRFLDNGTLFPENRCLCPDICLPSGAANISSCKFNSPSFISLPHFEGADEYYLTRVEGMTPNASKHELFYVLEPTTGSILEGAMRLQLNMFLKPVPEIKLFENVSEYMVPILWFQETFKAPEMIFTVLRIFLYLPLILRIMGTILLISGLYLSRQLLKSLLKSAKQENSHELKQFQIQDKEKEANETLSSICN